MKTEGAAVSCREEEGGAGGTPSPADSSDLHVGHAVHDLCKINSYYEAGGSEGGGALLSSPLLSSSDSDGASS